MSKEHYDRVAFFDAARQSPFPGRLFQDQVDGMGALLDAWEPTPFTDRRWLAYIFATTLAETGTMVPRHEMGKGAGHSYGNKHTQTGQVYYGRGLVQLTWHANYVKATKELNDRNLVGRKVDLVNKPDQALEPDIAAVVLIYGMVEGWFTTLKLSQFFNNTTTDWVNARKIVNALDRAHEIAGYGQAFNAALTKAATQAEPVQPPKPDEVAAERDLVLATLIEQVKGRTGATKVSVVLEYN